MVVKQVTSPRYAVQVEGTTHVQELTNYQITASQGVWQPVLSLRNLEENKQAYLVRLAAIADNSVEIRTTLNTDTEGADFNPPETWPESTTFTRVATPSFTASGGRRVSPYLIIRTPQTGQPAARERTLDANGSLCPVCTTDEGSTVIWVKRTTSDTTNVNLTLSWFEER